MDQFSTEHMDRIHIRDLGLRCFVGINEWEQEKKQDLSVSITLYADLSAAGHSDKIEDGLDYRAIKSAVVERIEGNRFALIERIAEVIAELCLSHSKIQRVDVTVDKLSALRFAKSVAVEITRFRRDE
jgi:FolB domain-containing protein